MNQKLNFNIRPADDGDLSQILKLLDIGLGSAASKLRTPEFWDWKHVSQPFGPSIVFVAEADDRIVGLRAFMRWAFSSLDEQGSEQHWQAVRAVDTVTHPEYRRMGIFRRLNKVAIEAAKADGVDFIFNTPNAQSGAGYLKQGWQEVGTLPLFFRISRWQDTVKAGVNFLRKKGREAGKQWQPNGLELITTADQTLFSDLADDVVYSNKQLKTYASPEYFRWRYARHPYVTYYRMTSGRPNHSFIARLNIRFGVRELVLCEMMEPIKNGMVQKEMASALGKSGCSYSVTHISDAHPNRRYMEAAGFRKAPQKLGMTLVFYPLSDRASQENLLSLDRWAFSMGTLEVF